VRAARDRAVPSAEIDPPFACLCAASLWCLAIGAGEERRGVLFAGGVLGASRSSRRGPPYFMFAAGALLVWLRHRRCRGVLAFALAAAADPRVLLRAAAAAPRKAGTVAPSRRTDGRPAVRLAVAHVVDTPLFWLARVPARSCRWCCGASGSGAARATRG